MRNRVDKLGVSEPEIRKQGENQIIIELPGVHDAGARRGHHRHRRRSSSSTTRGRRRPALAGRRRPDGHAASEPDAPAAPHGRGRASRRERTRASLVPLLRVDKLASPGPRRRRRRWPSSVEGGEIPEGAEYYVVPEGKIILTCGHRREEAAVCPAVPRRRLGRIDLLLPLPATSRTTPRIRSRS